MKFTYRVDYFFKDLFGNRGFNNMIISTNYLVTDSNGVVPIAREMQRKVIYKEVELKKIQLLKIEAA